jgi:hypothetical protein
MSDTNKPETNSNRITREETKPDIYKPPVRDLSNNKILKTTQSSESFQKLQNNLMNQGNRN